MKLINLIGALLTWVVIAAWAVENDLFGVPWYWTVLVLGLAGYLLLRWSQRERGRPRQARDARDDGPFDDVPDLDLDLDFDAGGD